MTAVTVSRSPAESRQRALELALRGLAPDQAAPLVASLGCLVDQGVDVFQALCIATKEGYLYGAAWVQPLVGRVATLWLPQFLGTANSEVRADLARYTLQASRRLPIDIVQTLIEQDRAADATLLERLGFRHLAELLFLHWELAGTRPVGTIDPRLGFRPHAADDRSVLKRLLRESYHGTLDCPQLEGLRDLDDTIDGYQSVGEYNAELWWVITWKDRPVGTVLLSPYGGSAHWELVYMGLSPEVRGRGLGQQVLERIRQVAAEQNIQQILLAVDAANLPARHLYDAAGFREWGSRSAYIKPNA
jgi:mycothiol synthase